MVLIKYLFLLCLSFSILSCSSTGGTIGGLFPAPKFTEGSIKNDAYIFRDGDFSISLPHKKESYEYKYLKIKEKYNELGAYVSFGPAAIDQSIYRVEIGRKSTPKNSNILFEDTVNAVVARYSQQLEFGYKSKLVLISKEQMTINNVPSYKVVLKQATKDRSLLHEILFLDYDSIAVMFWVQTSSIGAKKASLNTLEFAESFKVLH